MKRGLPVGDPLFMFYASNEPKSVHARDPGDCRDNYEKLAERVSHSLIYMGRTLWGYWCSPFFSLAGCKRFAVGALFCLRGTFAGADADTV